MPIQCERKAINVALCELHSSMGQDVGMYELREAKEFPESAVLSFKLCKRGENYTRVLVFLFDQGLNAIDPNWTEFPECVARVERAVQEFWNDECSESNRQVWVRGH